MCHLPAGTLHWARALVVSATLLLACQPAAAPTPATTSGGPPAAATAPAQAAAKPAQLSGSGAPAVPAPSLDWDRVLAATKSEGRVAVAGPPFPGLTSGMTREFERAHGIAVDYVGAAAVAQLAPRIEQEAAAGRQSLDIVISGGSTVATLVPKGLLEPIKDKLLLPEVTDPTRWRDGQITWVDRDGDKLLRAAEWQWPALFVNPRLVDPASIRTWDDLLKPEYKGKITAFDPLAGIGSGVSSYLFYVKGEDYVVRLYRDQDVNLLRDNQQLASLVARGTYPIGLGLTQATVEPLRKEGLPIEAVFPAEEPVNVTSGFGIVQMVKNPPHPNAAVVFLNWFLTREGQETYERGTLEPSRRVDVNVPETPDYVKMRSDARPRIDNGTTEWWVDVAPAINRRLEEVLNR